jgi:hypothetical protein
MLSLHSYLARIFCQDSLLLTPEVIQNHPSWSAPYSLQCVGGPLNQPTKQTKSTLLSEK